MDQWWAGGCGWGVTAVVIAAIDESGGGVEPSGNWGACKRGAGELYGAPEERERNSTDGRQQGGWTGGENGENGVMMSNAQALTRRWFV